MATLRLVIDKHHPNKQGKVAVKLEFGASSKVAQIGLDIFISPKNWDRKNQLITSEEPKFKIKNSIIQAKFDEAEEFLTNLKTKKGGYREDAKYLRDTFEKRNRSHSFTEYFQEVIKTKKGKTQEVYQLTYDKIIHLYGDSLYFDDIDKKWLKQFEKDCSENGNKVNTIGIHLRNIRHVFNCAIDEKLVKLDDYPFRNYEIKREETPKRALSVSDFRKVVNYNGTAEENWARDVFMLIFYLIGINSKDLFLLDMVHNGYILFNRSKTLRLYRIKIEPEAQVLMERLKGKKHLLEFADHILHHENFRKKVNKYLKNICDNLQISKITTYSARHSWATYASELDIPEKTIAMALGHADNSTTGIYIKYNNKKIDDANRKVIDYALGKKRFKNLPHKIFLFNKQYAEEVKEVKEKTALLSQVGRS